MARVWAKQPIRLSLDLFDTTLIRRSSNKEMFRRLGERAKEEWSDWTLTPVEFARWRSVSEERANREHGSCRFMLNAVYKQFAQGYPICEKRIDRLMELELELEAEHLMVVPSMRHRIEEEHDAGRAVLFLSDMYLPSNWLSDVLRRHGLWQDGDMLYVSGEAKASKSSGELFAFAKDRLGARLDKPLHLGDNPWSDVQQADASGWRAKLFSEAIPTPREKFLANHSPDFGALPESLAAGARVARLRLQSQASPELTTHIETITGVAAPILVSYVLWCMRKAKQLGLKRLYFMTRDGIVLHNAFQALIEKLGEAENFDARLLGASRQVCRMSNLDAFAPELPGWTTLNPHEITVTSCLFRVGLRAENFKSELERAGFRKDMWERPMGRRETARLSRLLHKDEFREAMAAAAKETRELYDAYLEQSGLHDGEPAAIVDIGWRGSTFDSLLQRLPETVHSSLHLFLFGFLADSYLGLNGENIHAYYCDEWRGLNEPGGNHLVSLLEDFVAVKQGALVGFETDENNQIVPTFRNVKHEDVVEERFALNMAAPRELIETLSVDEINSWSVERVTPVWKRLMDDFWNNPTAAEVQEFSRHQQEVDQSGHVKVDLAEPYKWSELCWWLAGYRPLSSGISSWSTGRRALTKGPRGILLRFGERIHSRWPGFARRMRMQKESIGDYLRGSRSSN